MIRYKYLRQTVRRQPYCRDGVQHRLLLSLSVGKRLPQVGVLRCTRSTSETTRNANGTS